MYKIDSLTLISGIDIPIPELGINIHQPTVREIAYIGEKSFYEAAQTLVATKEKLLSLVENVSEEDKVALSGMSDFELFLRLTETSGAFSISVQSLLSLLFPAHSVQIEERFIFLLNTEKKQSVIVNDENFSMFQEIVSTVLCLQSGNVEKEFNPAGDKAREIVDKIKRAREKAAKQKGETPKQTSYLSKYISGLGIATNSLNINNILDLTLYQLLNQIERYGLYSQYDISLRAKMAGAKDVEDIDWLKDIEN